MKAVVDFLPLYGIPTTNRSGGRDTACVTVTCQQVVGRSVGFNLTFSAIDINGMCGQEPGPSRTLFLMKLSAPL